ncbi:MAG: HD-GYP domain-containing protein [Actinomycetota bacterium]
MASIRTPAQSSASTSATDISGNRWGDRRWASFGLRALVVLTPILASLLLTRCYVAVVARPQSWPDHLLFWTGAFVVAIATTIVVDRFARRLLPLAALFRMSLVFPDEAPSRFKTALRQGNPRKLEVELLTGQISSSGEAAQALLTLISLVGDHDRLTRGHSERVRAYSEMIGEKMDLHPDELEKLRWGALIHDVGKLNVPPEILNKPGKPDDDEWEIIRSHPASAEPYLEPLRDWLGEWALAATEHHERYDGRGYPLGLAGAEISRAGRIVAVADAFDVMTSARSYKKPLSPAIAREELIRNAGAQFDPDIVRAFLEVSLGRLRVVVGPVAWLNELAWVARVPETISTAAVAAAVSAGSIVAAPLDVAGQVEAAPVERVVVEATTTTTTVAPTSTTTAPPLAPAAAPASSTSTTTSTSTTSTTASPATTTTAPVTTTTTAVIAASTTSIAPTTTVPAPATTTTAAPTTTTTLAPTTTAPTTTTTPSPSTTTTTAAPPSGLSGYGFLSVDPDDLPSSLAHGRLTSNDHVFVWREGATTLADPLTLRDPGVGGWVNGDGTTTVTIPAGTSLCTYHVHSDPSSWAPDMVAGIDFGGDVVGLTLTEDDLDETEDFEVDDVDHHPDGLGAADRLKIAGGYVEFELDSGLWTRDQIRIFVAC